MNNTHLFPKQRKHPTSTERSRRVARMVQRKGTAERGLCRETGATALQSSRARGDCRSLRKPVRRGPNKSAEAPHTNAPAGETPATELKFYADEQFANIKGG